MKDLTPKRGFCIPCKNFCPSVFEDGDDLLIIGERANVDLAMEVLERIGPTETIVRVPKGLLEDLNKE